MLTTTVRVAESAHQTLKSISAETGEPMATILEEAIEQYRRKRMFEEANAAWAKMRADSKEWAEELEERRLWEATLMDGIEEEEVYEE